MFQTKSYQYEQVRSPTRGHQLKWSLLFSKVYTDTDLFLSDIKLETECIDVY